MQEYKMRKAIVTLLMFLIFILVSNNAFPQCCSGNTIASMMLQSGVSGGYGVQFYNAAGFNNYISQYNQKYASTSKTEMGEFGTGLGFKFGANAVQFHVDQMLIGLKISYQQMKEKNSATRISSSGGEIKEEFNLSVNSFGIGFTSSLVLSKRFDIKFIDAMLTWNTAKLVNSYSDPYVSTEEKLESVRSYLGFAGGVGAVFYIIPKYISVEANGGYSLLSISEMQFDGGELLAESPDGGLAMKNFISSGGWFAFIQLNFSVPI
jgi:hypothetical protein